MNEVYPNGSHIHIRYSDYVSSHHCHYPMKGYKNPKMVLHFDFSPQCPEMKRPDIELSQNIDSSFSGESHIINIYLNV